MAADRRWLRRQCGVAMAGRGPGESDLRGVGNGGARRRSGAGQRSGSVVRTRAATAQSLGRERERARRHGDDLDRPTPRREREPHRRLARCPAGMSWPEGPGVPAQGRLERRPSRRHWTCTAGPALRPGERPSERPPGSRVAHPEGQRRDARSGRRSARSRGLLDVWVEGEIGQVTVVVRRPLLLRAQGRAQPAALRDLPRRPADAPFEAQAGLRVVAHGRHRPLRADRRDAALRRLDPAGRLRRPRAALRGAQGAAGGRGACSSGAEAPLPPPADHRGR